MGISFRDETRPDLPKKYDRVVLLIRNPMDTVLAEFNRRKSEHNHTGKVIDTNFQSVIYEINFSQVALII